jgi:hypothetical protein
MVAACQAQIAAYQGYVAEQLVYLEQHRTVLVRLGDVQSMYQDPVGLGKIAALPGAKGCIKGASQAVVVGWSCS